MWRAMLPQCHGVFQRRGNRRGRRSLNSGGLEGPLLSPRSRLRARDGRASLADPGGAGPARSALLLLVAAAHRCRLTGQLERLAGIDDAEALLGLLDLENGHVAVHV